MAKKWFKLFRVYQWPKNILLFAVPFFAGRLEEMAIILKCITAFIVFSLVASAMYIMNDISDLQTDRAHPTKKFRPLASGEISVQKALFIALFFIVAGIAAGFYFFPWGFGSVLVLYALINVGYSLLFKNTVPLDVFCVASGYILRIIGGGYALSISVSPWLFLTGFWVALYITFSKRFSDIRLLINKQSQKNSTIALKEVYRHYEEISLFGAMIMSGAGCLMTYGIYTLKHGENLILTIIPASYGIFRYLVIATSGRAGDPLKVFITDKQIMVSSFVFLGSIAWILYS